MRIRPRQLLLRLMRWTGLIRLCQFIHRKSIVILMIHGVMDERGRPSWVPLRPQLSPEKLDEYLRTLSRRYHFVSLVDAAEMLQGKRPVEPYSVVLTFDDGYRNNVTHALPVLRKYNAPATFFVPTGFLENPRPFWCDRLDYALQYTQVDGRQVRIGSCMMRLDSSSREALCTSYMRLRRTAKEQKMSDLDFLRDIDELATQLESESGKSLGEIHQNDDWSATVTWEQVQETIGNGVTIGSHTVDHTRLGLVDQAHARDQLTRSKHAIEARTGQPCVMLCYPNGSYDADTVALARACGYLCAVTTDEGLNRKGDDVMKLKRFNVSTDAPCGDLVAQICNACGCLSWAKRQFIHLYKAVVADRGVAAMEARSAI